MLPDVKGTTLPGPPWKAFSFERVLQYYDGPRLLIRQSSAGQLYLAWWSDADESTERWIYLPLSERRLRQILWGEIPSLDALSALEDGHLLVLDEDLETDTVARTILTEVSELPTDSVPRAGARLNIPVPMQLNGLPTRENAHIVDIRIENPTADDTRRVSARTMGQFIGNLQRLVDALGHAVADSPTSRGNIPEATLKKTRLDPVGTYAGSLGILLETNDQDDLFGESLARQSLKGLFELFDAEDKQDDLTRLLSSVKSRVSKNYKNVLLTIGDSLDSASVGWRQPGGRDLRRVRIDRQMARSIVAQIEEFSEYIAEQLAITGTLLGGNLRTLRFEIETDDGERERYNGTIHEEAIDEMGHVMLGSLCRATLEPLLQINEATGEERTTYTLLSIASN